MGFRLILTGLLFFFNPCIHIVDFLPDFIGGIFLCFGLRKLADVEDRFYDARKYARIMLAVYALKTVLSLFVPVRWQDGLLPITFMFSVGESLLFILFFTSLFGAIEYAADLHDGEKHLRLLGDLPRFCVLFSIIKCALAFLPESFALFPEPESDYSYNAARVFTLTDAKPYAVLLCFVAVLALGIWYIARIVPFFRALAADKTFCGNLEAIYRERVLDNPHLMARRRFRTYFLLQILGVLLLLDLTIDAVNLTPDFAAYAVILVSIFTLSHDKKCLFSAIPLFAVSVVRTIFQFLCDAGVNRIMEYESYFSFGFAPLENGSAIYILTALCVAEGILFVLFMRMTARKAAAEYVACCGKPFLTTATVVYAAVCAFCSVLAAVYPLCQAYCYHVYINDTLTHGDYSRLSNGFELAQGYAVIATIAATVLFAVHLYSLSRKADMELAPPEYR